MSSFTGISDQLLAWTLVYGYPILGLVLLIGAVGLPVPASLVATVAGSLVADGDLDPGFTLSVAVVACVAGDLFGYWLGRLGGRELAARHGRWLLIDAHHLDRLEAIYERWAGPLLLLSRSLLAIVAPAVNLLAGASGQKLRTFVAYDVAGRLLWVVVFVGLGYGFSGSAEAAADLASSLSGVVGGLGFTVLLLVAGMRHRAAKSR